MTVKANKERSPFPVIAVGLLGFRFEILIYKSQIGVLIRLPMLIGG